MNILVVDDEKELAECIANYLEAEGISTHTASNGAEALLFLENEDVDLMIVDYQMSPINGEKLIAEIKTQPEHRHLPIILLSGYLESFNATPFKDSEVLLLEKPISMDRLVGIVKMMANRQKREGDVA